MKKFLIASLFALVFVFAFVKAIQAETVSTFQDISTFGPYGVKINGLALTANRWTGWMRVDTKRTVCFDIDWTDADSSVTSVDLRCETSRSNLTADDAGYELPVYTATSSGGITTVKSMYLQFVGYTGGAPGSTRWNDCVTNIPGPFINCQFHAGGTPAAGDVITVYARGITP